MPNLDKCAMRMDFVCRGCGAGCCRHRAVPLSPVDYWRLAWHLERRRLKPAKGCMLVDPSSGLPVLWMAGEPCQFLMEVNQMDESGRARATGQEWCGIWQERPNECRSYPVMTELENQDGNNVMVVRHIEKCAGFGASIPVHKKSSVYEYVRGQIGEDRWMELFLFSAALLPQIRGRGLYWEGAGGRLSEKEVLTLGVKIFYPGPPMLQDPSADHDMVIGLLGAQIACIQKGGWQGWISPFGMDAPVQGKQIRSG